jgi:hypothetical protein
VNVGKLGGIGYMLGELTGVIVLLLGVFLTPLLSRLLPDEQNLKLHHIHDVCVSAFWLCRRNISSGAISY